MRCWGSSRGGGEEGGRSRGYTYTHTRKVPKDSCTYHMRDGGGCTKKKAAAAVRGHAPLKERKNGRQESRRGSLYMWYCFFPFTYVRLGHGPGAPGFRPPKTATEAEQPLPGQFGRSVRPPSLLLGIRGENDDAKSYPPSRPLDSAQSLIRRAPPWPMVAL